MAAELVDITLPTGEAATVPQADLAQAIAAGAVAAPVLSDNEKAFGGGLGQAASFALGAGRTASFGLSDGLLIEGANIAGGEQSRRDMIHGLNVAKDTNQYATMGGEAAGLFLGAGEGIMAAGNMVEEQVAARVGEGLLGRMATMGARGGVEGAMMGVQRQLTEDTLGDHAYNGELLTAAAEKDALLGAAIGAGIGGVSYFGSKALGMLRHAPGPRGAGLLDEVAGASGAGKMLREEAAEAESLIKNIQKTGVTSEEAAIIADEVKSVARARTAGGPLSGLVDDAGAMYAAKKAGDNPELREVLERGYVDHVKRLGSHEGILDNHARTLAEKGTAMMRGEDTLNRIHFTERPEQFAKMLDPSKVDLAADAAVRMTQGVDRLVVELEQTAMKGGSEVGVRRMRKMLTDTYSKQASLVDAATGQARENGLRDLYMSTYKLKQEVGKLSGFGKAPHMKTEGENLFSDVYEKLRTGLEDESVWGRAGAANREWNETFAHGLPRRQDFGNKFGVSIDQAGGVPRPEVDFDKARSILADLRGGEVDDIRQGVKSAKAFVDDIRSRANAIEKYAEITPQGAAEIAKTRAAAEAFETAFDGARKEAAVIGRVRQQAQEEQAKSLGGVLGLATDVMTKPLQTMERLGVIKATTERFEKGIENAMNRFFEGKGSALMRRGSNAAEEAVAVARPRADVVKEIGELRTLQANQPAMQMRVQQMLGDVSDVAPKTASAAAAVTLRALTYLAEEAPTGRTGRSFLMDKPDTRYSDQELSVYETKRTAAFKPETVIAEMKQGKLNRDGIRTVKVVYPQLFASMQEMARTQILRLGAEGKLDKMPRQQQAALAILLETPPDGTWMPDFVALMQSTKAPPPPPPAAPGQAPQGGGRRPIKMETSAYETEAQQIEGRTT